MGRDTGAASVGPEWRFHVEPPGEYRRPLVPDVAFLSYARMPYEQQLVTEEPGLASDAVVEVISAGDRERDIEEKVRVYLAAGTNVVFLVDPAHCTVTVVDNEGRQTFKDEDIVSHPTLPGFQHVAQDLFTSPEPK